MSVKQTCLKDTEEGREVECVVWLTHVFLFLGKPWFKVTEEIVSDSVGGAFENTNPLLEDLLLDKWKIWLVTCYIHVYLYINIQLTWSHWGFPVALNSKVAWVSLYCSIQQPWRWVSWLKVLGKKRMRHDLLGTFTRYIIVVFFSCCNCIHKATQQDLPVRFRKWSRIGSWDHPSEILIRVKQNMDNFLKGLNSYLVLLLLPPHPLQMISVESIDHGLLFFMTMPLDALCAF